MSFIRLRLEDGDGGFSKEACMQRNEIRLVHYAVREGNFIIFPRNSESFVCEIYTKDGKKITMMSTVFKLLNEG